MVGVNTKLFVILGLFVALVLVILPQNVNASCDLDSCPGVGVYCGTFNGLPAWRNCNLVSGYYCWGAYTTCTSGQTCNEYAVPHCVACVPSCTGKLCGPDGCGGTCGTCNGGTVCNATGQCVLNPVLAVSDSTLDHSMCASTITIYVTTNKKASCKYDISNAKTFDTALSSFSTDAAGLSHSATVPMSVAGTFNYYVYCKGVA